MAKKAIIIGLFVLFAVCILVSTITLAAAIWTDKESLRNGPIVIITGKFIEKVTPIIIWNNPVDITYETALSSTQLDAIASNPVSGTAVQGTLEYTPSSGTVLGAGTYILNVSFTPTDTANYTTASANVSINVTQATPTITWNNPANITYGTALTSTQLDATSSVPGSFVYNPPSGTVLSAGTNTLNATFTPTDIVNYTTATANVSINVTQATPTIIWNNPANITYGTALSSTQLDAIATYPVSGHTVPGNFVYTPPSGTVLSAGTNTLNATFTPADTANYTTASASVFINVIPTVQNAALTIVKSASPTTYDSIGQTLKYTYTVTNNGNVSISAPITVTDDKFGTISLQSSGILSPGSSVTGTTTYKIIDADINVGYVVNLAYAIGSFNNQPIISPQNIETVRYKQPTNDIAHNNGFGNGGYGSAVVPMVLAPMIYGSPMYSSPMYSSEPYGCSSEPYGTTDTPNSESNGHKAKAHLIKHKHKHHPTKHNKTGKKSLRTEKLK